MTRAVLLLAAVLVAPCLVASSEVMQADSVAHKSAARQLLQGIRPFSKVQQHKSPKQPSMKRKTFDREFPKRMLLNVDAGLTEAAEVGPSRQLLQGIRPFSKVQQHKSPKQPSMKRKTFDREFPKRMLLNENADLADVAKAVAAYSSPSRQLLQGIRPFSKVQQHKSPKQPSMKRKAFDREFPKRMLLSTQDADAVEFEADMRASRQLQ